jgi:integrase
MVKVELKGIHAIKRTLADGSPVTYHYAWRGRGSPCFWKSTDGTAEGGPEYLAALAAARPQTDAAKGKIREVIIGFINSGEFRDLAPRTQSDLKGSFYHPTNGIDHKFGNAPLAALGDKRLRKQVLDWRDGIGGKVGDDRLRHLQRLVKYAKDRHLIHDNPLTDITSLYRSNRADVIWMPDEITRFEAGAPINIARILVATCETGLRPGDLVTLTRAHIHDTPKGRRIVVFTAKGKRKKRMASIPVTARMGRLIDSLPKDQDHIIVTQGGTPYTHENYLGDAVSEWRDKLKIRADLPAKQRPRLYDARGTAATRLLSAGADMKEIATHMGWSLKHASEVIERYVALSPEMTDGLALKLARAERKNTRPVK